MGGSMALIYAALHPERVKNLVLWATPIDFEKGGKLTLWSRRDAFDADAFVDAVGNAAPEQLQPAFDMLIPTWRLRQWTTFSRYGHLPVFVKQFVALARWTADNVEVPAEVFRVVARDLYQDNKLLKGGLRLGGREVRLDAIKASTLNLAAAKDHIVVPACAHQLAGRLGTTDVEEKAYPVGHLGLAMGPEALTVIWPHMMTWLASRS
jgi:polyhydroxyalkanoate synthase